LVKSKVKLKRNAGINGGETRFKVLLDPNQHGYSISSNSNLLNTISNQQKALKIIIPSFKYD
jgi:hypothetical protein